MLRRLGVSVLVAVGLAAPALLAQDSGGKILDRPAADILRDSTLTAVVAPGSQMGPYRIVAQIGEGGMGAVYEAIDQRLGHTVALKQSLTSNAQVWKYFEREARLLARLNHVVLPRVSDYFTEN